MATLTSLDLRTRLTLQVGRYQQREAESRADLNFLDLGVGLTWRAGRPHTGATRALNWELAELADVCGFMAEGQHSSWQSRLLDSALRLNLQRAVERGDAVRVACLLCRDGAGLPPHFVVDWDEDRLTNRRAGVVGLRMDVSRAAIAVFAAELAEEVARYPLRLPPKRR
ncbi:MAG: hypothetical protein KC502_15145 [Myxococcales bacterium]|nr:hypothetical protein [Myxococcales bacterium]